jgi:hypothetical protein
MSYEMTRKAMMITRLNKHRAWRLALSFLMSFLALSVPLSSFSQTENQSSSTRKVEDEKEIACQLVPTLNLVLVEVEVRDSFGNIVRKLDQRDFLVYEDRKKQKIEFFSEDNVRFLDVFPIKYTIGYYPSNESQDGKLRRIRVRVRDGKEQGLSISYYPKDYIEPY